MNKIKLVLAGIVTMILVFSFVPAQADEDPDFRTNGSYWVENPNLSVEFWQGDDWGKLNFNHTELTPRDGECDGHAVRFYLRRDEAGGFTYRYIDDTNGCDPGGGMENINPNNWDYVKLCEYWSGGSYCTAPYYLPWGN